MKLVRWGPARAERWGMLDSAGAIRALPPSLVAGPQEPLAQDHIDRLLDIDPASWPVAPPGMRLGPPVTGCGKIVCVGLNYRDHARESGMEVPQEPVIFMKANSALSGPDDALQPPPGSTKLDWEVELAAVIGREGRNIPEREARSFVAGFCIMNDVSDRAFQLEGTGQWVKGKSADTFAPLGPWLVTRDEIADPQDLSIWLKVNGSLRQESSTRHMIVGVDALISYVSRFMSLRPGDVIATGTPPGVGLGMNPPQYLGPGDVVELGISGLGQQRQSVVRASV
jgi:2-keto-4-pentenoate hydratase/2-oxohepta-3-ene-1,7-dioic acid hydratase in catechol pathway